MYDIRLYSFKTKTNYINFTQEHEGFVRTNNNVKVISVTIHEFDIARCKNLYDGVEVEDINILECLTVEETAGRLQHCKMTLKCKSLNLKLTDEQAFGLLL